MAQPKKEASNCGCKQHRFPECNVMDRIKFKVRRVSNCGLRQLLQRSSRGLGHLTKHGVSERFPFVRAFRDSLVFEEHYMSLWMLHVSWKGVLHSKWAWDGILFIKVRGSAYPPRKY